MCDNKYTTPPRKRLKADMGREVDVKKCESSDSVLTYSNDESGKGASESVFSSDSESVSRENSLTSSSIDDLSSRFHSWSKMSKSLFDHGIQFHFFCFYGNIPPFIVFK